ncbi:Protein ECERIFERUM 7 [Zostera marina]|uniref:Protein ECERIFERUM 7 n=1 Tax=Zostera marina TaxID=29655 RepID=A0A0K9NSF7_ZOSMR|nr:Protein ECERIFERUM 7 [Zostera marina]
MGNVSRMTVNERKFIETAILNDLRIDGRRPFNYRPLTIKLGREDGSSEVHLGQTHVMAYVTAQLSQPYRDRPNEGSFSVFSEFSPMADPLFEIGRPGESAIELGRVIDRGLRESKAIDAVRLDIHILDNGGNLIDAANIAALSALSTFRRPECTVSEDDGQEVTIHPPETREPLPLIIHHLPVAITFAFFNEGNILVIDPSNHEEIVSGGRMTVSINTNSEICAIQKAGGEGVMSGVVMQCMRIASMKAADITKEIKNSVEIFDNERTLRKIKRHSEVATLEIDVPDSSMNETSQLHHITGLKNHTDLIPKSEPNTISQVFIGQASNWDPYSMKTSSHLSKHFVASPSTLSPSHVNRVVETISLPKLEKNQTENTTMDNDGVISMAVETSSVTKTKNMLTLKDAVDKKRKMKKKMKNVK